MHVAALDGIHHRRSNPRYITFLTIGYMVARGLAKSGTRANTRDNA